MVSGAPCGVRVAYKACGMNWKRINIYRRSECDPQNGSYVIAMHDALSCCACASTKFVGDN